MTYFSMKYYTSLFSFPIDGNSFGKILSAVFVLSDVGNLDDNKRFCVNKLVGRKIFLVRQVDVLIDNK